MEGRPALRMYILHIHVSSLTHIHRDVDILKGSVWTGSGYIRYHNLHRSVWMGAGFELFPGITGSSRVKRNPAGKILRTAPKTAPLKPVTPAVYHYEGAKKPPCRFVESGELKCAVSSIGRRLRENTKYHLTEWT